MQFKPTLLALALAVASTGAFAANVTTMSITGGSFNLGGSPGTPGTWTANVANAIGGNQAFGSSFTFFGNPVDMFNSNGGASNTYAPYGGTAVNGGDAGSISAAINGSTITADLTGWTAYWNGTNFNQGAANVTGNIDAAGNYTLSWSSTVVGGPFNGQTGNWSISGVAVAAPVPEASTYGMMVVGLGLVGAAVMRRRKA